MAVKIVRRESKSGISINLQWVEFGKRKQSTTGLVLIAGTTKDVKAQNQKTLACAERLRLQKELELAEDKVTVKVPTLIDYYKQVFKRRKTTESFSFNTVLKWQNAEAKLTRFLASRGLSSIKLNEVSTSLLDDFVGWLLTSNIGRGKNENLCNVSVNIVTSKLMCVLKYANREDYIKNSIASHQIKLKEPKPKPSYLTEDELEILWKTPLPERPMLKCACLFSAETGLRISDLRRLRFDMVQDGVLRLTTQKTKSDAVIPLSAKAKMILAECDRGQELVFNDGNKGIRDVSFTRWSAKWAKASGIEKNLHPHLFRDTFCVRLLSKNVGIFTVSKLLTHSSVQTTQKHYASVTPSMLTEAIDVLNR